MRRLLLLLIASSSGLYAAAFTTATCTLNGVTQTETGSGISSCTQIVPVNNQNLSVNANAAVNGFSISANASGSPSIPFAWSADAQAGNSETFATGGPFRLGVIEFDVVFYEEHDDFGFSSALSDGVHQYVFAPTGAGPLSPVSCGIGHCEFRGTLPFDLGSAFQASIDAAASVAGSCEGGCPFGEASLDFSLFEANGTTPAGYYPVDTPEPFTSGFVLLGVAVFAFRQSAGSPRYRCPHR